jgi:hypothetical protein
MSPQAHDAAPRAIVDPAGGCREFGSGEGFIVPKGFVGEWVTLESATKMFLTIYRCRARAPDGVTRSADLSKPWKTSRISRDMRCFNVESAMLLSATNSTNRELQT